MGTAAAGTFFLPSTIAVDLGFKCLAIPGDYHSLPEAVESVFIVVVGGSGVEEGTKILINV